jgi:hypothetical protein
VRTQNVARSGFPQRNAGFLLISFQTSAAETHGHSRMSGSRPPSPKLTMSLIRRPPGWAAEHKKVVSWLAESKSNFSHSGSMRRSCDWVVIACSASLLSDTPHALSIASEKSTSAIASHRRRDRLALALTVLG